MGVSLPRTIHYTWVVRGKRKISPPTEQTTSRHRHIYQHPHPKTPTKHTHPHILYVLHASRIHDEQHVPYGNSATNRLPFFSRSNGPGRVATPAALDNRQQEPTETPVPSTETNKKQTTTTRQQRLQFNTQQHQNNPTEHTIFLCAFLHLITKKLRAARAVRQHFAIHRFSSRLPDRMSVSPPLPH